MSNTYSQREGKGNLCTHPTSLPDDISDNVGNSVDPPISPQLLEGSQILLFEISDEDMASTPASEETLEEELNPKITVEDAANLSDFTLSDSRDEVPPDKPPKRQGSPCSDTKSGSIKRRKRKKNNWTSAYRRRKNLERYRSSKQIPRAVYPVNYQYSLESFSQNVETEKSSSKHSNEVAPFVIDISNDDDEVVASPCGRLQHQNFYSNGIHSDSRDRRNKPGGHNWTTARCVLGKESSDQISKAMDPGNSQYTPMVCFPNGKMMGKAHPRHQVESTVDDSVTYNKSFDFLLKDHNYFKSGPIKVLGSLCLKQTAEMNRNTNEESFNLDDHFDHARAVSVPVVDVDTVILSSPDRGSDASVVSDQPSETEDKMSKNVSSVEINCENPTFWPMLESSVRSLLHFPWMTRGSEDRLSLMRIPVENNVAVQIGITFETTATHYFVHNRPLPVDHFLRLHGRHIGNQNLRDAVDTVLDVYSIVVTLKICSGVQGFELFWNTIADGFIEERVSSDSETTFKILRSRDCHLLVEDSSLCKECKKVINRLRRRRTQAISSRLFLQTNSKFRPSKSQRRPVRWLNCRVSQNRS